ncbi:MAG: signal peptidase II [Lachnospiraceae bacterium]|nr:signal peptidase II [Lachnospiraceae bacterium]
MYLLFFSAFSVLGADQYCKHKIRKDTGLPRSCFRGRIVLCFSKNRGMFMNLLQNHPRLVSALTGILLLFLSFGAVFSCQRGASRLFRLAFGLLLGGGASNVYDHLVHGFVTDYISFCRPKKLSHIVYNLADFAIFLSVILFAASEISDT